MITHVNMDNFEQEVLQAKGTVLVDFYADWCGPCQMQGPIIEELSEEMPEVKFCKLDTDKATPIAIQYGVQAIPTILILKNGEQTYLQAGLASKDELISLLK